jgi:hypothetical protein
MTAIIVVMLVLSLTFGLATASSATGAAVGAGSCWCRTVEGGEVFRFVGVEASAILAALIDPISG